MNGKTKLYVFEKFEIALIFVFMILIAITSFIFGVRIGKSYSYKMDGFGDSEKVELELRSKDRESVEKIVSTKKDVKADDENIAQQIEQKLKEEFKNINAPAPSPAPETKGEMIKLPKESKPQAEAPKLKEVTKPAGDKFSGKYTIQIASYRSFSDAEEFAESFKMLGYTPIINEAKIKNRGIWYRVSLGTFDAVSEAKKFIVENKDLFTGNDYTVHKFE